MLFFSISKIPSSLCSKCIFFTNLHILSRSQFYSPRSTSLLAIYPFAVHFRVWSCIAMLVASFWWKPEEHLVPTLFFSGACSQHLYCQKFILLSLMVLNNPYHFDDYPPVNKQFVIEHHHFWIGQSTSTNYQWRYFQQETVSHYQRVRPNQASKFSRSSRNFASAWYHAQHMELWSPWWEVNGKTPWLVTLRPLVNGGQTQLNGSQ